MFYPIEQSTNNIISIKLNDDTNDYTLFGINKIYSKRDFSKIIYIDPTNGDDTKDGLSKQNQIKTLTQQKTLYNNDKYTNTIFYLLSGTHQLPDNQNFTFTISSDIQFVGEDNNTSIIQLNTSNHLFYISQWDISQGNDDNGFFNFYLINLQFNYNGVYFVGLNGSTKLNIYIYNNYFNQSGNIQRIFHNYTSNNRVNLLLHNNLFNRYFSGSLSNYQNFYHSFFDVQNNLFLGGLYSYFLSYLFSGYPFLNFFNFYNNIIYKSTTGDFEFTSYIPQQQYNNLTIHNKDVELLQEDKITYDKIKYYSLKIINTDTNSIIPYYYDDVNNKIYIQDNIVGGQTNHYSIYTIDSITKPYYNTDIQSYSINSNSKSITQPIENTTITDEFSNIYDFSITNNVTTNILNNTKIEIDLSTIDWSSIQHKTTPYFLFPYKYQPIYRLNDNIGINTGSQQEKSIITPPQDNLNKVKLSLQKTVTVNQYLLDEVISLKIRLYKLDNTEIKDQIILTKQEKSNYNNYYNQYNIFKIEIFNSFPQSFDGDNVSFDIFNDETRQVKRNSMQIQQIKILSSDESKLPNNKLYYSLTLDNNKKWYQGNVIAFDDYYIIDPQTSLDIYLWIKNDIDINETELSQIIEITQNIYY